MTAAVIASTLLTATACSKTFAPVDTLPAGTEMPADTSTRRLHYPRTTM